MDELILKTIKESRGVSEDDTGFDSELLIFINSIIIKLNSRLLNIKDKIDTELIIDGSTKWSDYIIDDRYAIQNLGTIKSYISLKIKTIFDPSPNQTITNAIEKELLDLEWTLINFDTLVTEV